IGPRMKPMMKGAAGMPAFEVCSFVPPKLIPQFKDAVEVVEATHATDTGDCLISALIPNMKGAERGVELGMKKLNFVASVSETHNLQNVRRKPEESIEDFRRIVEMRDALPEDKKFILDGGLSTAFGCTLEGTVDPAATLKLAQQFVDAGADHLTVCDTVGYANPKQVRDLFRMLQAELSPDVTMTAHFHDTRGLGLANMEAALDVGIRSFDACLAGLGGCPWAPGATGNMVMEDGVFMAEAMGLRTGVDLDKLCAIREIIAANLPGERLSGAIAKAGVPKDFRPAAQFAAAAE
ncbi:MAG: hydroxymethylglutaryl-CoA lyase, partial [Rickettsiales bacterium]